MSCDFVVRRLSPHLDGELPETEAAVVREHLTRCDGCAHRHRFLADAQAAYRAHPGGAREQRPPAPFRRWPWAAAAGIAATLAVLVTRVESPPAATAIVGEGASIPGLDCGHPAASICRVAAPGTDAGPTVEAAPGLHAGLPAGLWTAPGRAGR